MKASQLRPETLVGKRVEHYMFGKGKVVRAQDGYIVAAFCGVERMFEFPAAFGEYLTVVDKRLQKVLPVCTRAHVDAPPPPRGRKSTFVYDEYDTAALADLVHCNI